MRLCGTKNSLHGTNISLPKIKNIEKQKLNETNPNTNLLSSFQKIEQQKNTRCIKLCITTHIYVPPESD